MNSLIKQLEMKYTNINDIYFKSNNSYDFNIKSTNKLCDNKYILTYEYKNRKEYIKNNKQKIKYNRNRNKFSMKDTKQR